MNTDTIDLTTGDANVAWRKRAAADLLDKLGAHGGGFATDFRAETTPLYMLVPLAHEAQESVKRYRDTLPVGSKERLQATLALDAIGLLWAALP